ncbi:MAG: zinc ABC transporter substrate-binding protein [Bacteroidota bacterium]
MKYIFLIVLIACGISLSSCRKEQENSNGKLQIITTTGMIQDIVQNIAGDKATVVALMGSGVDPHLYKATANDLTRLGDADVIFYNGLHLEGKMADVFEKLNKRKPTLAVADGIEEPQFRMLSQTQHDPHIWFDVKLWAKAAEFASKKLQEIDKPNAELYKANTQKYLLKLDSLDNWVRQEILKIPAEQRVLITAHDAFGYFGRAYGVEVIGLQGISTVSEFGVQDVVKLVDLINQRKIKAIFVESSVPKRSIEAVIMGAKERGGNVSIGGQLYSDAMGAKGTPEGTYIGMVSANVQTIVNALK